MTKRCLLRLKHQVQILLPEQTAEECVVVFLKIRSSNIAYHIIYADIYHAAFVYFLYDVERIMKMLDNKDAPIE